MGGCVVSGYVEYADGFTITRKNSHYYHGNDWIRREARCTLDETNRHLLTGWISRGQALYHVHKVPLRDFFSGNNITCIRAFDTDVYVYATWTPQGNIIDGPVSIILYPKYRAHVNANNGYIERFVGEVRDQQIQTRSDIVDFSSGASSQERVMSMRSIGSSYCEGAMDMKPYLYAKYPPSFDYGHRTEYTRMSCYYTHHHMSLCTTYDSSTGILYSSTRARAEGRRQSARPCPRPRPRQPSVRQPVEQKVVRGNTCTICDDAPSTTGIMQASGCIILTVCDGCSKRAAKDGLICPLSRAPGVWVRPVESCSHEV